MNDPLYREVILENWEHPLNYGVLKNPNIDVNEENPLCGDEIRITARIKENKIVDIRFVSGGCAISKAAASLLTQMVKGMTVEAFLKLKPEDFLDSFEIDFSPVRTKCALLGYSTLREGINKFNRSKLSKKV